MPLVGKGCGCHLERSCLIAEALHCRWRYPQRPDSYGHQTREVLWREVHRHRAGDAGEGARKQLWQLTVRAGARVVVPKVTVGWCLMVVEEGAR
jgi:hypothetical protein